jgi:hypothetical protein
MHFFQNVKSFLPIGGLFRSEHAFRECAPYRKLGFAFESGGDSSYFLVHGHAL